MVVIADSGSSKTSWRIIHDDGKISQAETVGMNPLQYSDEFLTAVIKAELIPQLQETSSASEVYFYGAGCIPGEPSDRIHKILQSYFVNATITVQDDLLAVARGVCGLEPGIACILGTGSNSCYYDGNKVAEKVATLGYILGDEGSGSWLGKELLAAYFRKELPEALKLKFEKRFQISLSDVLTKVYREHVGSSYLAHFSKFIFQNREHPFLTNIIYSGFSTFIEKNILKYEQHLHVPVHFSGSIAFYYSTLLRKACADKGLHVKNIVEGPIAGLTLYHQEIIKKA